MEKQFKEFLRVFVEEHLSLPADEHIPPFRLVEDALKVTDVIGHCWEWAAQYLHVQ